MYLCGVKEIVLNISMKKIALFILVLNSILTLNAQYFTNPVYEMADPFITYHDGYYYATGTTGGSIVLKKAKTLQELKGTPNVMIFNPNMDENAPKYAWWAPEIYRLDGKWYVYFTANDVGNDVYQSCYVIENESENPLEGEWKLKGRIYDPDHDLYFIDATIFELKGQRYMVYCSVEEDHVNHFPQRLYISKMDSPISIEKGRTLISTPGDYSWEGNGVNEGPEVIIRNGKVFLVYSTSGCWTAQYKLGMMEMSVDDDPMEAASWTKLAQPVFKTNFSVKVYAPGHHCFFTSPDGQEDWIMYHATPKSGGGCDAARTPRAQKLEWDENGRPYFGMPQAEGQYEKAPSGESPIPEGIVKNGIYTIVNKCSSMPLDLTKGKHDLNTNVQQLTANGKPQQQWIIQYHADGYYTINAVEGGLSLDVQNESNDSGANIQVYSPSGNDCQKWDLVEVSENTYRIISKKSGKALDIFNCDLGDGANLQQYDITDSDAQLFELRLISLAGLPENETPMVAEQDYVSLELVPNPASDEVSIVTSSGASIVDVALYERNGRLIKKDVTGNATFSVSGFPQGVYVVKVQVGEDFFTKTLLVK